MCTRKNKKQGSALAVVLVFAISIGVIIASIFRYSMGEARISHSNLMVNEARLAAESVLEHGMSQLNNRFLSSAALAEEEFNPLNPAARPLILTERFYDIFESAANSRIVLPEGPYNPAEFASYPTAIVAGRVPALSADVTIDTAIPGAELSTSVNTRADVIEVQVYGKATVRDARFGERTAYARQRIQVLEESLFRYGVFYDGDLTIAPGPTMTFSENSLVHSNGNIYVRSNNTLNLFGRVTAAGDFFYGREDGEAGSGNVVMKNNLTGQNVNLNSGTPGGFLDSTRTNFRALATEYLDGNLQTREHDVVRRDPPGFQAMRDMFESEDGGNFGYHMIMPPSALTTGTGDEEAERILSTVEGVKLSTRAGMTLDFSFDSSGEPVVTVLTHQRDPITNQAIRVGGELVYEQVVVPAVYQFWTLEPYERSGSTIVSGLFDQREGGDGTGNSDGEKSLIRIDMEALKNYLHSSPGELDADDQPLFGSGGAKHPSDFYNGGIYIQMPMQAPDLSRTDFVVPAIRNWAVDLYNGEAVPNPDYLRAPGRTPAYGMTLATNGALYVTGDFNVPDGDGSSSAPGNTTDFGVKEGSEAAVALAADSVTLLSNAWDRTKSRQNLSNRVATNTIFSAAVISGNVYGNLNTDGTYSKYSGGLENYPRFLEDWDNRTATIRGSFINLFRSEVQIGGWPGSTTYKPPRRDWGHNTMFLTERRPPIFTGIRGFRRVYFEEITEQQFNDGIAAFYN